jgi:carbonic anhydrase/acetyltransferase-like protein (isoleucine patch superfamily)
VIRELEGKTPIVHPTAFISEASYLVGDIVVGEDSSFWPGSIARADYGAIRVGTNTNIQDNCVLHTEDLLEIGNNVVIGHGAVVHGAKIGNNVLIGANAVLLEGSEVGDYCVIGAGAVVLEHTKIPAKSVVVGVPGKVKPINPKTYDSISHWASTYSLNAKRFKKQGLGIEYQDKP